MQIGSTTLEVIRGSVTDQPVDAIVNAANTSMRGGGGIDGRIHRAAGRGLMDELLRIAPHGAKTGEPVVTGGHDLPQKHIIHVAGPVWRGGSRGEPELLAHCYRNSLSVADERGIGSIAFCSISTGVYGYPLVDAAPLALHTALDYLETRRETNLRRVVFALWGEEEFAVFDEAFRRIDRA